MDDFASLIPGHGGVFDRVDCQLIRLATQIYFTTFIGRYPLSLARVRSLVAALSVADQRELHAALGRRSRRCRGLREGRDGRMVGATASLHYKSLSTPHSRGAARPTVRGRGFMRAYLVAERVIRGSPLWDPR